MSSPSSEAGDVQQPPMAVDPVELMDVGDSYSNPEVAINNPDNRLDEPIETSAIEPLVRMNNQPNVQIVLPTCSRDTTSLANISRQDLNQEFCNGTEQDKNLQDKIKKILTKYNATNLEIPKPGTRVSPEAVRKVGPYVLGPILGSSPVKSIIQCLAKNEVTGRSYTIKILPLKDSLEEETYEDRQGKMLLHNEYSLLSLLEGQAGVVRHYGFYKDYALEEKITKSGCVYTGKVRQRLCLVLDYLVNHSFDCNEFMVLQNYVIREKKLSEKESLLIFYETVKIVACLHEKNVVHRDLKLGNLVLNRYTRKVTITNFCLGKYLSSENDLLQDQRGSPAYISPDVLCGKPYLGKPSDMWALGVVLYAMLYGQFPFYDSNPSMLFNKIKAANYYLPMIGRVSEGTESLIRNLLVLQPSKRLTAVQVLDSLTSIIAMLKVPAPIGEEEDDQVVPDSVSDTSEEENGKKPEEKKEEIPQRLKLSTNFSKQITVQEQMHHMMKQQASPLVSRPRPYNQISVYRVDSDARELTAAELDRFRHLIPRDNQRPMPYGSNNRADGILSRVRHCLRNRSNAANQVNIQGRDYPLNHRPQSNDGGNVNNSSNASANNSNNNIGRILQSQASVASQIMQRQIYNASNMADTASTSGRLSRNAFNDVPIMADYNRSANSRALLNPNVSALTTNFRPWMVADVNNQENQQAPVNNASDSYPTDQDQQSDRPRNSNANAVSQIPHLAQRVIPGPQVAAASTDGSSRIRSTGEPINENVARQQAASQLSRMRSAFPEWLSSPNRLRQQGRLENMERLFLPRRLSLGQNRHAPYLANLRQLDSVIAGVPSQPTVRRVNSDSNLGRPMEAGVAHGPEPRTLTLEERYIAARASVLGSGDNLAPQRVIMFNNGSEPGGAQRAFARHARDAGSSMSADASSSDSNSRRNFALLMLSHLLSPTQEQATPSANDDAS